MTILGPVASSRTSIPFFLPSVPAGFPSPAQDHLEQRISLDELFGLHQPQLYLVRVVGNSLQGLGIQGDSVPLGRKIRAQVLASASPSRPVRAPGRGVVAARHQPSMRCRSAARTAGSHAQAVRA